MPASAKSETGRVVRHLVTPVVIIAVERDWLPEAAQGDVTEAAVILLTLVAVYGVSWWRDRQREAAT